LDVLVNYVLVKKLTPTIPKEHDSELNYLIDIINLCWKFEPYKRPTFKEILGYLKNKNVEKLLN
jgi:hypothetical protein